VSFLNWHESRFLTISDCGGYLHAPSNLHQFHWCLDLAVRTHRLLAGDEQELISVLDSRTLRPVNTLGLLVFSNNIKSGISDIRQIKRRVMACPWNVGWGSSKVYADVFSYSVRTRIRPRNSHPTADRNMKNPAKCKKTSWLTMYGRCWSRLSLTLFCLVIVVNLSITERHHLVLSSVRL